LRMLAKFLEALRTLNTGMSALQWLWAALLLVLPASVIGALYALRDDLWQRYGALGLALLILFAIMAVGVGCAGAAVLVYVRRPAPAPEKPKLPPDLPTHTMSILDAI